MSVQTCLLHWYLHRLGAILETGNQYKPATCCPHSLASTLELHCPLLPPEAPVGLVHCSLQFAKRTKQTLEFLHRKLSGCFCGVLWRVWYPLTLTWETLCEPYKEQKKSLSFPPTKFRVLSKHFTLIKVLHHHCASKCNKLCHNW